MWLVHAHHNGVTHARFHGRFEDEHRICEVSGCEELGEFRAPGGRGASFDGPGEWRWFCLKHVRAFNAGYDWFEGMNAEEILVAQSPASGWRTEAPGFSPTAGVDGVPRWDDFHDPLEAISARANGIRSQAERESRMAMDGRFTREEAQALEAMGLGLETDKGKLRRRYSQLVRRYHPDRNGGDRKYEKRLTRVVEAYQLLRKSGAIR